MGDSVKKDALAVTIIREDGLWTPRKLQTSPATLVAWARGSPQCDAAKPQCSRCQKQEKPCSYPTEERPKRRKYWDEEYVASLENQVKTLLAALEVKNAGSSIASGTLVEPSLSKPESDPVSAPSQSHHEAESTGGPTSGSQNDEPGDPQDRSLAAMEELSVMMWRTNIGDGVTIISDATADAQHRVEGSEQTEFRDSITPPPPKVLLYCQDPGLLRDLATLFLDNINSEHQFTPYRSTDFLEGYPYQSFGETFLHSTILATGAIFSTRSNAKEISEAFAQFAESLVFTCFRQSPTVHVVQGLCIMSWRSLALGRDHFGWIFISMAAGLCVHLRLHVLALDECEARSWQPQVEDIRTFWMFYLIDRTAISILGRNCVLPWRRVNVPNFEASFDPKTADIAQVSFTWQCKLWFLHDEQMDQIFTPKFEAIPAQQQAHLLVATHEALSNFFKSRDRRLDLRGRETSRHVLFFHMAYQMALLITLPPFLRCFALSKGGAKGENAANPNYIILILRSLTGAASMMIRLVRMYRDAHGEQWKRANPVVIHHLLSAAIVLLMNATSQTTSLKTQSTRWLKICIELLAQLKSPWPDRATKTIKVIRVLADRWGVLGALPLQYSYAVEPLPSPDGKSNSQESLAAGPMSSIPVPIADEGAFHSNPYSVPTFGSMDMSSMSSIGSYTNFDFTVPTTLSFGSEDQQRFDDIFADGGGNWLFGGEDLGVTYWGN
ncbi:putative Transcription factor domain-containing protein [Seiridium unicorne]|uniref:Transcription factor domain-containing protein n=1 Tax=Seiridium unicorne TaxID=138068 RepID=A0ABR2UJS0_9PEZI